MTLKRSIPVIILLALSFHLPAGVLESISAKDSTHVLVSLNLVDLFDINDSEQTITADFVIRMKWQRRENLPETWMPKIQIVNSRDLEKKIDQGGVEILEDGTYIFRQRYFGKLSVPVHSARFPFDRHTFNIQVVAINQEPVVFHPDSTIEVSPANYSIIDWEIHEQELSIASFQRTLKRMPSFSLEIQAKRYVSFYFWKIFIPITVVVIMSWSVFWVDPRHPGQLTVSVTSMLSLIAFQFTISDLMPSLAYLTRLDLFLLSCDLMVMFSLLESVYTSRLMIQNEKPQSLKIDQISRWAFPALYLLACIISFTWS